MTDDDEAADAYVAYLEAMQGELDEDDYNRILEEHKEVTLECGRMPRPEDSITTMRGDWSSFPTSSKRPSRPLS